MWIYSLSIKQIKQTIFLSYSVIVFLIRRKLKQKKSDDDQNDDNDDTQTETTDIDPESGQNGAAPNSTAVPPKPPAKPRVAFAN